MAINRRKEIAYTMCKTWRSHAMDYAPPSTPTTVEFGFVLRCERCTTVRHVHINPSTGDIASSTYDWPDDYRDVGVALSRAEMRLAEIKVHGIGDLRAARLREKRRAS